MTLNQRIDFAKEMQHDIIMVKENRYVSGMWEEREYAEKVGFKFVGTVAQLWQKIHE